MYGGMVNHIYIKHNIRLLQCYFICMGFPCMATAYGKGVEGYRVMCSRLSFSFRIVRYTFSTYINYYEMLEISFRTNYPS